MKARYWIVLPLVLAACSDDTGATLDSRILDRGSVADTRAADKGQPAEKGQPADKSQPVPDAAPGCAAAFAGCSTFEDATGGTATISFGGATGFVYSPKCLKVKVGQSVTFKGDSFAVHPLAQACGPAQVITDGTGTEKSFTFSVAGTYGYYCTLHGTASGTGMAGALQVVP